MSWIADFANHAPVCFTVLALPLVSTVTRTLNTLVNVLSRPTPPKPAPSEPRK